MKGLLTKLVRAVRGDGRRRFPRQQRRVELQVEAIEQRFVMSTAHVGLLAAIPAPDMAIQAPAATGIDVVLPQGVYRYEQPDACHAHVFDGHNPHMGQAPGLAQYLTTQGTLKSDLVIREEGGLTGGVVHEWRVEKSGHWTEYTFGRVVGKGHFSKAQLTKLAQTLAKNDLVHLPQETGTSGPDSISTVIKFGNHTATLNQFGANAATSARFLGIIAEVQHLAGKAHLPA